MVTFCHEKMARGAPRAKAPKDKGAPEECPRTLSRGAKMLEKIRKLVKFKERGPEGAQGPRPPNPEAPQRNLPGPPPGEQK